MDKEEVRVHVSEPLSPVISSRELSTSSKKIKLKHQLHHEDEVYRDHYDSCCFRIDKRALVFFSQLGISLIIMSFSIAQLLNPNTDCGREVTYVAMLTSVLGLWVPQPSMK